VSVLSSSSMGYRYIMAWDRMYHGIASRYYVL
jgi:hypothetical protein